MRKNFILGGLVFMRIFQSQGIVTFSPSLGNLFFGHIEVLVHSLKVVYFVVLLHPTGSGIVGLVVFSSGSISPSFGSG